MLVMLACFFREEKVTCVNFLGDCDHLISNLFQMNNMLIKTIVILFPQLFVNYD